MLNNFTAVFKKEDTCWIGFVEELPGANTQGDTLEEVRKNLKEAVLLILQANRDIAEKELFGKDIIKEDLLIAA